VLVLFLAQITGAADHTKPAVWLTTFSPLVYLPAWPLVGLAWWRRQRVVAALAAVAMLGSLWAVWPVLPKPGGPPGPSDGPTFTLGTVNALKLNTEFDALAAQLSADPPDVLLVQEFAINTEVAFRNLPLARMIWPYSALTGEGAAAVVILSRLPILDARVVTLGNPAIVARIQVGDEVVTVVNLHTVATGRRSSADAWRRSLRAVDRLAGTIEGPLVLAGDFNATPYHKPFRDLLDGPLHDAHQDLDQALDRTWGPRRFGGLPVALLDHVVLSPEVRALSIGDHKAAGSDHRLVTATLRVGESTSAPAG
jgi:endonuclease/exonuclease/phosphatase (EEP) superfamily protein YafD